MRLMKSQAIACAAALLATACVDGPFARINVADPGSSARVVFDDLPDSLFSRSEAIRVNARVEGGQLPRTVAGLTLQVAVEGAGNSGLQLLVQASQSEFFVGQDASLIPRTVTVYAVAPASSPRRLAETRIVVLQRPRSARLACVTAGCADITGLSQTRNLSLTLRDSLGFLINPGTPTTRFGEIVSRSPGIVEVLDRPVFDIARVRSLASGTAWIVFSGGGLTDSLQVSVTP